MVDRNRIVALGVLVCIGVIGAACVQTLPAPVQSLPAPRAVDSGSQNVAGSAQSGAAQGAVQTPAAVQSGGVQINTTATAQPAATATQANDQPLANPTPGAGAASNATLHTAVVHRGTITDELLANGRVAGSQENPLSLSVDGTVKTIHVKPGQQVKAGQPLIELDTGATSHDIDALRNQIALENLRLSSAQQTQSQAQVRQSSDVASAQDAVRRAEADLQTVQAGPSAAERKAAQGAVIAAQAALDRAAADLTKLKSGPSKADVDAATQRVAAAQLAVQQAQNDRATLTRGPTAEALQTAQREVASAQAGLVLAQAELDRLTNGPNPYDLRAADRAVQQANAALGAAQAAHVGGTAGVTQAQKDASVAAASAALDNAKDALAKLKEPPLKANVDAARNRVAEATFGLTAAQSRLEALGKGPEQSALDAADAQVASQQMALATVQQQLQDLQAPPSVEQLATANAAVDGARLALEGAQAKLDDVNSHPTDHELADAQARVNAARANLQNAQNGNPPSVDVQAQQLTLAQDQQRLNDLQTALANSVLRAPTDSFVVSIDVQSGEGVAAGGQVLTLAPDADAVIRTVVNQPGGNSSEVRVGQNATIQLDGGDGKALPAVVASVDGNPKGLGQIATFQVDWGKNRPAFGTTAMVRVKVQEKTNALLVPASAVHTDGDKKYVEYLENGSARRAEVTVGIVTWSDVEILSGLREGQQVFLDAS